jgi:Predicted membrane protein
MNGIGYALIALVTLPLGAIITFIPYLTRRTESFGVSIEENYFNDPEISGMRRTYASLTGAVSLLVIIASLIAAARLDEEQLGWLMPAAVGVMLAVHLALYLRFHFRMRALKKERGLMSAELQQTVVDTAFYQEKRAYPMVWLIPHLLVAAATAWICAANYDAFPEQLIMQYGLDGTPTRVVDKSWGNVLFPVWMQLLLIFIFAIVNYSISASKQQIDAANPRASLRRNLIFRRKWSAFTLTMGFLLTVLFGAIPMQQLYGFDIGILLALFLTFVAIILLWAVRLGFVTGQGGSRIRLPEDASAAAAGKVNRDDDKYWILGQFYYNPDDPALFLEKRFGIGWTMNFARPLAWIIFLAPVLLVAALIFLVERG